MFWKKHQLKIHNQKHGFLIHPTLSCFAKRGREEKKKKKPSAFPFHPFFLVCLISLGCRWLDEKNSRQIKFGAWGMILGDRVSPACWSVHLSALCWLLSCELQVWPPPIHPLMSLGIGLFLHKSSRDEAGGGGDGGWCKFTQVVLQPEGGGGVGG